MFVRVQASLAAGEVYLLDDTNFDTFTSKYEVVMVDFYADWCRFCVMLRPVIEQASVLLAETGTTNGVFAKVDCESPASVKVKERYGISKFPTLKLFRYGHALKFEYRGERSPQAMEQYILELLKTSLVEVHSEPELQDQMKRKSTAVVGRYLDTDEQAIAVFRDVAQRLRDSCTFVLFQGSPGAPQLAHIVNGQTQATFSGDHTNTDAVLTWADELCNPLVRELTFENGEALTEEGLPFLILFHAPDDKESVALFKSVVAERFKHEKVNINFVTADGAKFVHPLHVMGKTSADLPILAADTFKHMFLFRRFANIAKPGKLERFIADLHSGKLHYEFHNGPMNPNEDKDDEEQSTTPSPAPETEKPLTLKDKVEAAQEIKQEIKEALISAEASRQATTPEPAHDEDDDPHKPVPVRSVVKKLMPSEHRYSFAKNREDL